MVRLPFQTRSKFPDCLIEEAVSNFHRYFFIHAGADWRCTGTWSGCRSRDALIRLTADLQGRREEGFDRERTGITWAQFNHVYEFLRLLLPWYLVRAWQAVLWGGRGSERYLGSRARLS
jgi:hypothetical protein